MKLINLIKETGLIISCAGISIFFKEKAGEFFNGNGKSMEPTIPEESVLFVDKITPLIRNPVKGEVVIMKSVFNSNEYICKRVKYVAGEEFQLDARTIKVPEGFVWVEGDNSKNSFDSRYYGPMSLFLLVGIARFAIYPNYQKFNTDYAWNN